MRLDTISIQGLRLACILGVLPRERSQTQKIEIDLVLGIRRLARSALTGSLSATVDYSHVASEALFLLEHARFRLVETAAAALVNIALSHGTTVAWATATVRKPEALKSLGGGVPSLTVTRRRMLLPAPSQGKSPELRKLRAKGRLIFAGDGLAVLANENPCGETDPPPPGRLPKHRDRPCTHVTPRRVLTLYHLDGREQIKDRLF